MARVYLGRVAADVVGFERLVALKVMHGHLAESADAVGMFMDEARLAARIRHPNVVGTLDIVQDAAAPFIVMEFVEGPSLHRILRILHRRQEVIPIDVAARIIADMLTGLHAAHEIIGADGAPLNLVHRDVSPQNVLVGCDGVTRITDFGVARAEMRVTETRAGQLKGKIRYMPPEQVRGAGVDRRTDVYAAAVVLWEVLVGQRLFSAGNEAELVLKVISGATHSPRQVNPAVPEALDAVCMKALSLDIEGRYPTAAAFAEAIESATMASQIPVASTRRLSAFLDGLEASEGASDGSGIRWIRAAQPQGGTPSGMSLQSHSAVVGRESGPVLISDSGHPHGPPALPISSPELSSPERSSPELSSQELSSPELSSQEVTTPAAVALLAASAHLDGPRRRWLLPTLVVGVGLLVGGAALWVSTSSSTAPAGPPLAAQSSGAEPSVTAATEDTPPEARDEPTSDEPAAPEDEVPGGDDDGAVDPSTPGSARPRPAAPAKPRPDEAVAKPEATQTAPPKVVAPPPKPPPAKTTPPPTGPKSYHPDDL